MDRNKLQLDDFDVTSFDVMPAFAISTSGLQYQIKTIQDPNDPTANTHCFVCDDTVHNCPNQTVLAVQQSVVAVAR
jgi:hypothetical protein